MLVLANECVSRRHAELRQEDGRWYIVDVGSSNGVFVNDRRVSATPLRDRDQIEIGPFLLTFAQAQAAVTPELAQIDSDEAFTILDVIGRGGMATVYRARLTSSGTVVAVKVPILDLTDDTREAVIRFLHEAETTSQLIHPHIVRVLSQGNLPDRRPYLVMEYLVGGSLRSRMKSDQPLPEETVRLVGSQVASALAFAHQKGIVHRDLKPENVLFDDREAARLTDFGIALSQGYSRLTQVGMPIGTVHYMSPEQIEDRPVGPASDLYALGCMFYEMTTGRCPFEGAAAAVMHSHVYNDPSPVRTRNPHLSPEMNELISRLLCKSPDERPRSAQEVSMMLQGALR